MARNIILLGAGASFGSDNYRTPPLGRTLFNELAHFNPDGWGRLSTELSEAFRADFEAGMSHLPEHLLPPLQRAMAAYFFNFIPSSNSLYCKLAHLIKNVNWDGAFITLNYERLLEIAMIGNGINLFIGRKPDSITGIEMCLPHGCCNLFCESVRGGAAGISFAGRGVRTNGPVRAITNPAEYRHRIQHDAFPPVMSYFEPGKITTSGANFIEEQRQRYAGLISAASRIAIIGVKVRPHDNHIWVHLANTNAELLYCSGNMAGQEFEGWAATARGGKISVNLNGYFSECFDDLCQRLMPIGDGLENASP